MIADIVLQSRSMPSIVICAPCNWNQQSRDPMHPSMADLSSDRVETWLKQYEEFPYLADSESYDGLISIHVHKSLILPSDGGRPISRLEEWEKAVDVDWIKLPRTDVEYDAEVMTEAIELVPSPTPSLESHDSDEGSGPEDLPYDIQ